MKKILNTFVLVILMLINLSSHAQKELFIRVFDQKGKKIYKGYYTSSTDSSITLKRNKKESVIPISSIQTIKLKRSFGRGIWKGSLSGASVIASGGNGLAVLALPVGVVIGGTVGAISDSFTKRPSFDIQHDSEKWKKTREVLETLNKKLKTDSSEAQSSNNQVQTSGIL